MPGNSVMKSHEYRPVIGFLTDIIDKSFHDEDALIRSVRDGGPLRTEELTRVRARMDAAYKALERLLELILEDLDEEQWNAQRVTADAGDPEKTPDFPAEVFPADEAGQTLLKLFRSHETKVGVH
jgi:hypothetical protein